MRVYRNYDHRLKRAIWKAGDPDLFPDLDIPPSTAKGWIRKGVPFVVTADEFDQQSDVLVIENQRLRNELAWIKATQELQSFTFKLFGLQIQYRRLPLADSKEMLLAAISGAARTIGLAIALQAIGLSAARFRAWTKRQRGCELTDQAYCPRSTPTKLTAGERRTLRQYATDPKLAHLSTSALSLLAKRKDDLFASATTWCRIVREKKLRPLQRRVCPAKPKIGVRAKLPGEILHVDLTILRLLDGSRVFIQAVIDNASRYVVAHCVSQYYGGLHTRDLLVAALGKAKQLAIVPNVYCDSGSENLNRDVDTLIESKVMTRTIAQIEVAQSNSMIEAFFRRLKHAWLFVHPLPNLSAVTQLTEQCIHDHNELIPHSALAGATPAEVFHGRWSEDDREKLEDRGRAARNARIQENRDAGCQRCDLPLLAIAVP
jgi:transposase InsO family protein